MNNMLNENNLCCDKKIIKVSVYNYNGTYLSERICFAICMQVFIMHLILIDIILRSNIILAVCLLIFTPYLEVNTILCIINIINILLLLNIFYEIKILINTFKCKCD